MKASLAQKAPLAHSSAIGHDRAATNCPGDSRQPSLDGAASIKASRHVRRAPMFIAAARTALLLAAQIAVLWFFNLGASAAVNWLHAPIPGNVFGLTLLFTLLCSGIVKVSWLEPAATVLVKHLAFFFIPITIGIMDMGQLFALHGVGILFALAVSAAVGMAMCGATYQGLMHAQNTSEARFGSEHDA